MDRFFAAFGKIVIILVLVSGLVGGGIYIGKTLQKSSVSALPVAQTPTIAQTNQTQLVPGLPTGNPSPQTSTPAVLNLQKQQAGGFDSFPKYTISIPQGWQPEKTVNDTQELLTITNGPYYFIISQSKYPDTGVCTYDGKNPQEDVGQYATSFVSIAYHGDPAYFRRGRGTTPAQNGDYPYAICQKNANTYSLATTFGSIEYMAPAKPNPRMLSEMDQMLQSLQLQ